MSSVQETAKMSVADLRWLYLGGKRTLLIAGGCFLAGLIVFRFGYSIWSSARAVRLAGVTTIAQVVDKGHKPETRRDSQPEYWLHYRYRDTEGRGHDGRVAVGVNEWNSFQKYDDILIYYRRDRPDESQLAEVPNLSRRWAMHMGLSLGGLLYVGGGLVGVGGWWWATRKARLVVEGKPVLGEVTDRVCPFWGQALSPPRSRLHFQFVNSRGSIQTGKTHWLPEDIACCWNPGNSILVLCDPADPSRSEADVFQVRDADKERLLAECR